MDDRYGNDVLAGFKTRRGPTERTPVVLARGLVIEHTESEFCGAVVAARQGFVDLEDYRGKVRTFALTDGFLIDGKSVALQMPKAAPAARKRTASGSFAVAQERAKVAMPSRIFVEGKHDAELIEQVWGDDLRVEGVVVEMLQGVDHLTDVLREFGPGPNRRAGVLVDHLVAGSKETRLTTAAIAPYRGTVHVVGHPYVDIWQAVKPERVGLVQWPVIPRDIEWKKGICLALGWPADEQADIAQAWQRIRGRVRSFRDLEPSLVGRVEELIDFVTLPPQ
ncbi:MULTISPECIES: DUF3097 domain-containing protein [unclassified Leucobacter]|uniref:DUF3097 domain-containing protein n=1 Tax=unclassified Leucobacter TaxID=2621730 RepID=UPI00165DB380|nr:MULTISPECIES: DUF3097 domain-containing protein [unclassified Leucobacter]MBC9926534.1 DUF3097 domain-containing protein [Leucobacter sp. cx-169]